MFNLYLALPRYIKILEGKEKPKFAILSTKKLDEKIRKAWKNLERCELCEWKCRVNRKKEKGRCGVSDEIKLSSYFFHYGEEFFLVPSFTIFFWSCNFSCQYCQNWTISQRKEIPEVVSEKKLAEIINQAGKQKKCKNINFVGGEPTPYLPFILKALKEVKVNVPLIWNSNFYMTEKTMDLLDRVIDVYLSDFKYGNDKCAERLSKIKNYTSIVKRNHLRASKQGEIIIRHLVLPSHINCCTKPIFKWISENLGKKVIVNIMDQYRPEYLAYEYGEINRFVKKEEMLEVLKYAESLNLNFMT